MSDFTAWPTARELAEAYPPRPIAMLRDGRLALIYQTPEDRPTSGGFWVRFATDDGTGLLPADHAGSRLLVASEIRRRFDQVPDADLIDAWRAYDLTRERLAGTHGGPHGPVVGFAAEIARLQDEVAQLSEPDLFWDGKHGDSYLSAQDVINARGLSEVVEICRARQLPTVWGVTVIGDDEPRTMQFPTREAAEAWLAAWKREVAA